MQVVHNRYQDRGFAVVAISSDEEGHPTVAPFVEALGVSFPILLDPKQATSTVYGATELPVTFVLDRNGRVIAAAQGARAADCRAAFPDSAHPWRGGLIYSSRGIAFAWRRPEHANRSWKDAAQHALATTIAELRDALGLAPC